MMVLPVQAQSAQALIWSYKTLCKLHIWHYDSLSQSAHLLTIEHPGRLSIFPEVVADVGPSEAVWKETEYAFDDGRTYELKLLLIQYA